MARPPLRDTFILGLVALGAVLAAVGGWRYAKASAPVGGPIILITVDGLRANQLSIYDAAGVSTPTFDLLARDGVVFERAYAHASQSLPAHTSILSGRLPVQTGVRNNVGFTVPKSERLVQEMLRDRGYSTAGIVSTAELARATGLDRGFVFFDDALPARTPQMASWPAMREGVAAEDVAEHWLESARTSRAFLFLHIADLRNPLADDADAAAAARARLSAADDALGRLVRYLKRHQAYDQSTILVVGDHGDALDDRGAPAPSLWVDDATFRTPLIVKRPAGEGAGRRVRTIVQQADIAPTILDFAKAPIPNNVFGQSLKPLLEGSIAPVGRLVYAEATYGYYHFSWPASVSLSDGRYRLVRGPHGGLYDVDADGSGQAAGMKAAAGDGLAAALDKLSSGPLPLPVDGTHSPGARDDRDDRQRERLEHLGNVSGLRPGSLARDEQSAAVPADALAVAAALARAARTAYEGEWRRATEQLRPVLQQHPDLVDGWALLSRIALPAGRYEVAVDAARRAAQLAPRDAGRALAAAEVLFDVRKLTDARAEVTRALDMADARGRAFLGTSHELLMRIALAERDREAAERAASNAEADEPGRPVGAFVECRLAHDAGAYEAAATVCAAAISAVESAKARPIKDLHLLDGDVLVHLDRDAEAESAYLEEVKLFPLNAAARVGLATVYHRTGRTDEAAQEIAALEHVTAPGEASQLAAKFWMAVGEPRRAAASARQAALRHDDAAGNRVRQPAAR